MEQEGHFSQEEERKQLLLCRAQPGSEAMGPSLLSQLPHSGEEGCALWGTRSQAPGRLQKSDLQARINRDNVRSSTRSKKQDNKAEHEDPGKCRPDQQTQGFSSWQLLQDPQQVHCIRSQHAHMDPPKMCGI